MSASALLTQGTSDTQRSVTQFGAVRMVEGRQTFDQQSVTIELGRTMQHGTTNITLMGRWVTRTWIGMLDMSRMHRWG